MTVAIIGAGNMGKGIAQRLSGKTDLVIGSRVPASVEAFAQSVGARALSQEAAVAAADIILLGLPYEAALEFARTTALDGKVVIDITNPLTPDYSNITVGFTSSAGEEIQKAAPGAKVVKAFNTVFSALFGQPAAATAKVQVFLAGNDAAAVDRVADVVEKAGFAVERTGGLDAARLLEPLGLLNIRFGYGLGKGTGIAPAIVTVG